MAQFKDSKGDAWEVKLDAPTLEDIRDTFEVDLVDLKTDPLLKLRNSPMLLVNAVYLVCEDQAKERGISQRDFGKRMPAPPDPMLDAMREAIIGFFPSGRASHVAEVLAKFEQMATKTDELARAKMERVMEDEKVQQRMEAHADELFNRSLNSMWGEN